ncbi:MAG: CoA-binding protein [Deltaproteobacteria bacterium]|nr:CoA-binding protein [Deltaproteobacteria bacterium]
MGNTGRSPLYHIMNPESVAIFGASNSMLTMGTSLLINMMELGYKGEIFPIHRELEEVQGLKAYRSLDEIARVPDTALIVVPARVVPKVLMDCGKKGIPSAIIVSGGFRELGQEGMALEKEISEIAKKYGIRFIGPNCIGVVHPYHRWNTTIFHYTASMDGFIGMVSQSGSFITQMFYHLKKFGLGFSQGLSIGNQADLDMADCVEYLGECKRTKVIGLYIEGLTRPDKLMRVAREVSRKKPIIAVYVGGTESGSRAGRSHTGALSASDAIYDGAFRQCGIVRASSIEELFDFCWALGTQPLMTGNRTVVLTHSGGPGAAAADAAERSGLHLPPLSEKTRAKLREAVPQTGSLNNPIDLTFTRNFEDLYQEIPRILFEDPDFDGVLMYFLMSMENLGRLVGKADSPFFQTMEAFREYMLGLCRRFVDLVRSRNKPLIGSSFLMRDEPFIRELEDLGIPIIPSPERSARAMGALYRYSRMREALEQEASERRGTARA